MNKPLKDRILSIYGHDPETPDDLAQCVIAVINTQDILKFTKEEKSKPGLQNVVGFAWEISYRTSVSNTHSSPEGYPSNFMCRNDLPRGYPGWAGRVWIRYRKECRSFGSDGFRHTLTNTGGGGGGSYDGPWRKISSAHYNWCNRLGKEVPGPAVYSWDYRIYNFDWPALGNYAEQQIICDKLAGRESVLKHSFNWTHPDTLIEDAEFMDRCAKLTAGETT